MLLSCSCFFTTSCCQLTSIFDWPVKVACCNIGRAVHWLAFPPLSPLLTQPGLTSHRSYRPLSPGEPSVCVLLCPVTHREHRLTLTLPCVSCLAAVKQHEKQHSRQPQRKHPFFCSGIELFISIYLCPPVCLPFCLSFSVFYSSSCLSVSVLLCTEHLFVYFLFVCQSGILNSCYLAGAAQRSGPLQPRHPT